MRFPWSRSCAPRSCNAAPHVRLIMRVDERINRFPEHHISNIVETILDVTHAHSAGISVLTGDGKTPDVCGKRFFWPAIAGVWKPYIGGGTPRDFGPCGDVLDRNCSLLFRHLERRHTYFPHPINEGRLVECWLLLAGRYRSGPDLHLLVDGPDNGGPGSTHFDVEARLQRLTEGPNQCRTQRVIVLFLHSVSHMAVSQFAQDGGRSSPNRRCSPRWCRAWRQTFLTAPSYQF